MESMSPPPGRLHQRPLLQSLPVLVWCLLGALVVGRLVLMAGWPLMDTTEARYADIARRMVAQNDWVTPWFDTQVPFWGKPPLSFWMTVVSFRLFGLGELQARLPHFLCMLGVVALAAQLAAERSARQAAIVIVLLLGSLVVFTAAGAVQTDAPLVFGITLALASFWRVMHDDVAPVRSAWRWWFFVGLSIGVLAKGPLAIVLCGITVFAWLVTTRRLGDLWRRLPWFGGTVLFAIMVVPWFVLAEQRTPGFLEYFLVGEHVYRFTRPGWDGDRYGNAHQEAIGTIWAFAAAGWWPWTVLLAGFAILVGWRRDPTGAAVPGHAATGRALADERLWTIFTLAWAAAPLLLFTAARNTIWMYVLPGAVGAALWMAAWADRRLSERRLHALLTIGLVVSSLTVLAYLTAAWDQRERRSTHDLVQRLQIVAPEAPRIVFVGHRPFSASYYTEGRAERVSDRAQLSRDVSGSPTTVIVAIPDTLGADPPAIDGAVSEPLFRIGEFWIWRVRPIASVPAPPR